LQSNKKKYLSQMLFYRIWFCLAVAVGGIVSSALGDVSAQGDVSDAVTTAILDPGPLLVHLPGIAGFRACDYRMLEGLSDGGFKSREVVYDWTDHDPGLQALAARARNEKEAQKLADLIGMHAQADPVSSLVITGHSGGCGLAVWTLEKLPRNLQVDNVLLMAPALSPQYDLSAALRHVRGHLCVFSSTRDTMVLYTGTRFFGTIDGVQTEAAGYSGFVRPPHGDVEQYKKLISIPYQPEWEDLGNWGGHLGAMSRRFSTAVLTPLLIGSPAATQPSSKHAAGN
jgi:hypothetical protein